MRDPNEDADPERPGRQDSVVLCVDDEAGILCALARTLAREPYELFHAPDGRSALDVLERCPVKVVVADERMPGMSGSELLSEVGRRWPLVGKIMLTGFPGRDAMLRGLEAQADFLLSKPWDDELLRRAIRRLLAEVERSRKLRGSPIGDPWLDIGGEGGEA